MESENQATPAEDIESEQQTASPDAVEAEQPTAPKENFSWVRYSASDGLQLAVRVYGDTKGELSDRTPIVCLPGLTRNSADFDKLATYLSQEREHCRPVYCFDLRGRGKSAYDRNKENYSLPVEADDVLAGCTALGIKHAIFIGTSRGGLIIHVLAAMRPGALVAAVLNDVGPAIDGAGLAQIMAYQERLTDPASYEEAASKFKDIMGRAFPNLSDEDWMDYVKPMFVEKKGKLVRNFDPAIADALKAIDLSVPLPTLWPQFEGLRKVPLMTIRGENSSLLSQETVDEMKKRYPAMKSVTATGQGHAPVLHIDDLSQNIADFIDEADHA